jgi:hypothetical protein
MLFTLCSLIVNAPRTLNGCIPLCPNSVNKNPPASTVIGHVLCTVCLTHASIILHIFFQENKSSWCSTTCSDPLSMPQRVYCVPSTCLNDKMILKSQAKKLNKWD